MAARTPNGVMHRADWVSLKDYVDTRLEAICKEIAMSSEAIDLRLESINKFRDLITEQNRNFMTKEEYRLAHKPIEDDVQELRDFMNKQQGKASWSAVIFTGAMAILGLALGIVGFLLKR